MLHPYSRVFRALRIPLSIALGAIAGWGATFGKVVPLLGGGADLVLDDSRRQVYLTQSLQNQVQVYSLQKAAFQTPIITDQTPLSAAISRSGRFLYVACYDSSTLDVIDLNTFLITARVNLPAKPEGVAVASDERVLISTTGSGAGNASNLLLLYSPASSVLSAITVTLTIPAAPTFPAPSGRPYLSNHSQLVATRDGTRIAGVSAPTAGAASLFVYESVSGTVPRARIVTNSSTTVSISDNGARIICGPNLFDAATLQVLAQQNLVNSPYPITPGSSFTTQTNQGGSIFSPDSQTLYWAFNIPPVTSTGLTGTGSQMILNDPDNLLIRMGIQLPENLSGKLVMSSDGANAYALSDSGFIILPLSTISQSPLAVPNVQVTLVTNDPCGVSAATSTATISITNAGKGNMTAAATLLRYATVNPITQPNAATAPGVRVSQVNGAPLLTFTFNSAASTLRGTVTPPHDFLVTSPESINIPNIVRVYENSRDSEARGTILPLTMGPSSTNPFPDLVMDQARQRIFIANAGLNRVDVYDVQTRAFLAPIKVGQLPTSMAMTPDGLTLYVANGGGETISLVDPVKLQNTGTVSFPPVPFNSNTALAIPSVIAASTNGLQILTTDGTLWKVVGSSAIPRGVSKLLGQSTAGVPNKMPVPSSMTATPGGEYILLSTGTGIAYLYDSSVDDWVVQHTVTTGNPAGYIGPAIAGALGQYYVVNGVLLNSQLVPVNGATGYGGVAAMAAGRTTYLSFNPVAATSTTAPTVSVVNSTTGLVTSQVSMLEGTLTQPTGLPGPGGIVIGGGRLNVGAHTMAADATGTNAYAITASGLSIIPLTVAAQTARPTFTRAGMVNLASYQTAVAPNGLLSIFGTNLGTTAVASSTPLPTFLGGTCVTMNNVPLPLFLMSPTQINAQIPPNTAAGNFTVVVHSITNVAASTPQTLTVSKYAPAVFVDSTGQLALLHADGSYVNQNNPATRDEPLTMYVAGLGVTTGGPVTTGNPSPSDPLALTAPVEVFFGPTTFAQSPVIVDFSGLAPGLIGVYQLNLRIPGFHMNGDSLLVTVRIGNVNSPSTGLVVPTVAVD